LVRTVKKDFLLSCLPNYRPFQNYAGLQTPNTYFRKEKKIFGEVYLKLSRWSTASTVLQRKDNTENKILRVW